MLADIAMLDPFLAEADPGCQVSEVARLLWSMIAAATLAGALAVRRPSWRAVGALLAGASAWMWVDMEGPTLVSWGTHGLHLADVPVLVAGAGAALAALRLLLRRH